MDCNRIPFRKMFRCCTDDSLFSVLDDAFVLSVNVDRQGSSMELTVEFSSLPAPVVAGMIESGVAAELGLSRVSLRPVTPKKAPAPPKLTSSGRMLFGKNIRGRTVPISELDLESGRSAVAGEIFGLELRDVRGGTAKLLSFNITDNTGSLHVSKFIRDEADRGLLSLKNGMYVSVAGMISYDRWHGDIAMEPSAVKLLPKPERTDNAPGEKRVELHMHSRYSQLDALTNIDAMVAEAARWGHRAVALTDHGVLQGFPDLCKAGKEYGIKVIYGVEGYFINDVDDRIAIVGEGDGDFSDEFVAFDIETTGLSTVDDRITEIGAVIMKDGRELGRFQTFVDPGRRIPNQVTALTGISDADVAGAPKEAEAVKAFLDFAGGRPLVAHNADFDSGFIAEACARCGMSFDNLCCDTLILSQSLLPQLKKHSLDSAANHLGLPEFRHHRASDDAATCGLLFYAFLDMLRAKGASRLSDVNPIVSGLRAASDTRRQPKHIIILIKDQAGVRNLYEIVSRSHLEYFKKQPIIPKSLLMSLREGLIIGSACENGELFRAVTGRRSMRELRRIAEFYDFLEIQPICNNAFLVRSGTAADEEQLRAYNRRVVELGELTGKPVAATGDVHFLEPEHEIFRRILLSNKYEDCDEPLPLYFKTTDEMLEEFSYLGSEKAYEIVVTNTNLIADMCSEIAPLPTGLFTPKIENSAQDLEKLVYDKMHRLYGDEPPAQVLSRVEEELKNIIGRGYDVIYMSAVKLVAKSNEAGYLVGSRGSVGSSLVAFMSGITEVNALPAHYRCPKCRHTDFDSGKGYGCGVDMPDAVCPVCGAQYEKDGYDIPFETFLGFGGDKVPDIDLNFSGEYQAQAHRDTIDLFGADHVFRAGTIGTIAEKTAYGYVKKYLEERGRMVSKVEENRPAAGLTGVKRTTGQHPGGLVVIPQDKSIYDFCPIQHPADDTDTDIITTHFEYHAMESNLLKLDMLGHDDPTMIHKLQALTGLSLSDIRLDDEQTMLLFRTPEVLGIPADDPIIGRTGSIAVPEFGTKFTREMLVDTQPNKISTLIRLSGFSHGTDVWAGNAKELVKSGVASVDEAIGCRDDIMLFLISKGVAAKRAFKIMETVRKGKGLTPDMESDMRAAQVPDWYIESCKKIQYLFPKALAVAYVMMALRLAWFKVHRPLEFYCAYFSVRSPAFDLEIMTGGTEKVRRKITELSRRNDLKQADKDLFTALEVCYEFYLRGFSFAPIDLKKSLADEFRIEGGRLIPPFTAIAGLGKAAANDIYDHRGEECEYKWHNDLLWIRET
ncbi:MAG: PolC-type DNA polymerase III [Oscillospiraceae bacterium]|nr:PolC-type DNA polymerase III [Oscillospiraceae bacterium]